MKETAENIAWRTHDEGRQCQCVMHHTPKITHVHRHHIYPLGWGGPDTAENTVWLCPSSHEHCHVLLRAYKRYEGPPPWEFRRQFNSYIRGIAEEGWARHLEAA